MYNKTIHLIKAKSRKIRYIKSIQADTEVIDENCRCRRNYKRKSMQLKISEWFK